MTPEFFKNKINTASNPLPGSVPYTNKRVFSVKGKYNNKTLIEFLTSFLPHIDESHWTEAIDNGRLLVNGFKPWKDQTVMAGERLTHIVPDTVDPDINANISLVYDDEVMMVLNKPAPIPMHACGRFNRNTLLNLLQIAFPNEPFKIVHRLDADTTGIVILAKTADAATKIGKQFEGRTTKKIYLAMVEGLVEQDQFICKESIGKEKTGGGGRKLSSTGLESETIVTVIERDQESNKTLLQVEPKSGRTNQIRIHLASIGHPIVGDKHYSDMSENREDKPLTLEEDSLCLHAWKLTLNHPVSGDEVTFSAPPPEKFTICPT